MLIHFLLNLLHSYAWFVDSFMVCFSDAGPTILFFQENAGSILIFSFLWA